ncbi:possible ribosomal protein S1 fragment [Bacillus sp. NRRL B-14911]|uniref:4-hydroxy-3-methylbut-2-enyl diphosphate reductase n=1 Tax=Bacillus sp. NRRL B-14911 TaxID=313627 RepID=UPI00006B5979|nr:4-hydroxy-3-methylbut-2-enyl diphosphate reductase [Bacillus sp. NRRL B-14911]EAR66170.1 possible ribosomal protein S1 fragment [Bacillus sp. NRRL B-14911]
MVVKSWSDQDSLEILAEKFRNQEIVSGVIRSSMNMKLPVVREDGNKSHVEEETLIVQLPAGITGYCVTSEFREREYKSLTRFIGTTQQFVITDLNLEHQIALLSEKRAAARIRDSLWDELSMLEEEGQLQKEIFDAVVSGYNQQKGIIYVRLNGQDAYMYRREWSWYERDVVDAQVGETIQVKIELLDTEQRLLRVSRKMALPDPYDFILTLRKDQLIAGKVSEVHPIHGLFVEVENGVVLKAGKVRSLEEPSIGDIVTCRVRSINAEERKGKLMIIDYPRGKRKRKDLGSFLFE